MGVQALTLGNRVDDAATVYRMFAYESFRRKNRVREKAWHRPKRHPDGLSLGTTPEYAALMLNVNHGYCSILTGDIHAMPYGLEVHLDADNAGHVLLLNVPCIDSENDEERKQAELIAGELKRKSVWVTSDPFYPPGHPALAAPDHMP
jgi:hypothetical protein